MTARAVEVRRLKWPDRVVERATAIVLAEDEFGRWFGVPAGTGWETPDGGLIRVSWSSVECLPRGSWWRAAFIGPGSLEWAVERDGAVVDRGTIPPWEVYVDICLPPVATEDGLSFVDLELDVVRTVEGAVEVRDEDEFEALRPRLPDEVARAARAACDQVTEMVRARSEPFGQVGEAWLGWFEAGEVG